MEVFDAIRTRRSIRKFKDKQVPWDNIVTIMQAGKYAPSAGNLQNWKFIHVKSDEKRKAIVNACMQQEWMEVAPVYIVVVAEPKKGSSAVQGFVSALHLHDCCHPLWFIVGGFHPVLSTFVGQLFGVWAGSRFS